jgi:hypothetical protein
MKKHLTQVLVLSASLMLLSAVLPVNSSASTDGCPLPPPHISARAASSTFTDGCPLPPPHIRGSR